MLHMVGKPVLKRTPVEKLVEGDPVHDPMGAWMVDAYVRWERN